MTLMMGIRGSMEDSFRLVHLIARGGYRGAGERAAGVFANCTPEFFGSGNVAGPATW